MSKPDFEFDDSSATDVAGTPQGDGDFETDNLPSTGETSSGGQLNTDKGEQGKKEASNTPPHKPTGIEWVIDEISTGKLMP